MRQKKNNPIEWKVSELITWSEVPETFILMVVTNGWLNNIYGGDHIQRERLQFVRRWWAENIDEKALERAAKKAKEKKRIFEKSIQLKLF